MDYNIPGDVILTILSPLDQVDLVNQDTTALWKVFRIKS